MTKRNTKNIAFYLLMILIFGSMMYFVVREGKARESIQTLQSVQNGPSNLQEGFAIFIDSVSTHIQSTVGILLLQIITILLVCRIFGWIFQKIGQPTVIGEIVAGIVLGPSVLGHLMPEVSEFLFPISSLNNINILSQFGLILFMFAIGMELDISEVKKKLNETILISHTSTIVPFFFGMLSAFFVYKKYANPETPFLSFALFIGIAMSITAFPVLARIIQEKGLTKTHLGTISLASAANGDITAWCLLAVVIAIAQAGSMLSAVYNILFSILYIIFMFTAVRSFLRMVGNLYHNKEVINKGLVAFIFLLLIISSYFTEILGLHALFGAFMAGVVMPGNAKFRKIMTEKVEDVSLALFLPLFFVSTGLRTEIGLLNTPELWIMCIIFTVVAIVSKFGGALFSSRFVGETWRDSLYMGALMNTRGLMELVILTIGYEMKILTPPIFVMLVLMTLVTTFMTTPLVSFIKFCYAAHDKYIKPSESEVVHYSNNGLYKVLLSFGRAGNGQIMLDVADQMFSKGNKKLDLTALHLTVGSEVNPLHAENFEEISFGPILFGANRLNLQIHPRYEVSYHAGEDICKIVNGEDFDFLLVGAGISMSNAPEDIAANKYYKSFYNKYFKRFKAPQSWFYPGDLLKDKTRMFIEKTTCDVGIFINRNFTKATSTLVLIHSKADLFLLDNVANLYKSTRCSIGLLNLTDPTTSDNEEVLAAMKKLTNNIPSASILQNTGLNEDLFSGYNFMLIGFNTWNLITEPYKEALQKIPSTLIMNKKVDGKTIA